MGSIPIGRTTLDMRSKLADTPDLGSGAAMREGSSPFIRTTLFL